MMIEFLSIESITAHCIGYNRETVVEIEGELSKYTLARLRNAAEKELILPTLNLRQFIAYIGQGEFWRQAGQLGIGKVPPTGLEEMLNENLL